MVEPPAGIRSSGNSLFSGPYYTRKYGISGADYLLVELTARLSVLIKAEQAVAADLLSASPPLKGVCYNLLSPTVLHPRVNFLACNSQTRDRLSVSMLHSEYVEFQR